MGFIQQQQAERAAYEQAQQQQYQQQQSQQEQSQPIDFFADDAQAQVDAFVQQRIQQAIQPFAAWQQEQQLGEGEDRALDILEDLVAKDGDFLNNEKAFTTARALADVYFREEVQRHGYGPEAAEAALVRAAGEVREYEKTVRETALNQHANQLKTLTGAAVEPGSVYGQGYQERRVPDYRAEGGSVSDRIFGGR